MKFIATIVSLSLITCSALAQNNDYGTQPPGGATGQGVSHTSSVVGRIIATGAPITKNFPIGQNCTPQQYQQPQSQGGFNPGTILGAVVGGVVGSRFGDGQGRDLAIAAGAATGAMVGNNQYQGNQQQYQGGQQQCQTTFEQRIVGYSFIAQYDHIQVQGFMHRQPQIGENVTIIVRSTFYAGSD